MSQEIDANFDFDPSVDGMLSDPTQFGTTIRLPFAHLPFWWKNGSKESDSGVRRFGGWALNEEDYSLWASVSDDFPSGLEGPFEWIGGDSDQPYRVYAVRHLWVVPVERRHAWFLKYKGDPNNKKDWKSATEWLCYGAVVSIKEKIVAPLGPIVLKAKSLSGVALDEAMKGYKAKTLGIRSEIAKGNKTFQANKINDVPSNWFYRAIGTFGKSPNFKKVGEGQNSNTITPAEFWPTEDFSVDFMRMTVANNTTRAIIADMKLQSKEWAADWNDRRKAETEGAKKMVEAAQGLGGQYLGAPDDDIPF